MRLVVLILLATGSFAYQREKRQAVETTTGFWWETLESNPGQVLSEPVPNSGIDTAKPVAGNIDTETSVSISKIEPSPEIIKKGPTETLVGDIECGGLGSACVPYYLCKDGFIVSDGIGKIDIRVGSITMHSNSKCIRFLEVCCKQPEKEPVAVPKIEIAKECGKRNIEGVHANILGMNVTQAQFAEYPWMVALLRVERLGSKILHLYACGGSLIHPNAVLTAAHCVKSYGIETFKVRAGEWDTQSEYELYPHQDRLVVDVVIHPFFHPKTLFNDFALLILESPFVLAPNINTICLPNQNEIFKDSTCIATGWGKDKYGVEGQYQNILKQVPLGLVPLVECEYLLRKTRLGQYYNLHNSFVCAGGKKAVDTCKGDGGSPLVCARPSAGSKSYIYYQVGIVAWGIGCGENGVPGVYADVTKAIDWINYVLKSYI